LDADFGGKSPSALNAENDCMVAKDWRAKKRLKRRRDGGHCFRAAII
jgi:hypothetical protein